MAVVKKETRPEKVKRERDALDCFEDILRYAKTGFAAIDPDDLDVRLRWYGLYTQRPESDGYFMLRVKIPNGTLTSRQLETLGKISVRFASNTGDITTRQGLQYHFVRIEDVPAIFAELERVGLTTSGACGDITRNVTGCPLSGIDADEIIETESFVQAIHEHFLNNKDFSNLPRKFKITVTGCPLYCTGHEINDVGLIALKRPNGHAVFDLWVGGGLGAKERFADRLGVHVFPEQVIDVVHHICAIFRDHGNRGSRSLARLKFLLADWGAEKFLSELEDRLGYQLTRGASPSVPGTANRAHIGIFPQKDEGLYYVGAATERGKFSGTEMIEVARLARKHASGRIRLTTTQNVIVLDVPGKERFALSTGLSLVNLQTKASVFRTGTIACTGNVFCKMALTETKISSSELIAHLENVFPDFKEPFRISVTGCPNSCAHYQVCDIGFVGDFINTPTGKIEAFRVFLGGHLGENHTFGRELNHKVPAPEIKFYAERLVRRFLESRVGETEDFQSFLARKSVDELEEICRYEAVTIQSGKILEAGAV